MLNRDLSGSPVLVRQDHDIRFLWGTGSPAPGIPADRFSVRWTRSVFFEKGAYRLNVEIDDGMRVWLDDRLLIDEWSDHRAEHFTADFNVNEGIHVLRVEYYENTLGARALVHWTQMAGPDEAHTWVPKLAKSSTLFDHNPGTVQ